MLGGCVIGEDDPREACRHCGAAIWGHGVYSIGDDLRVRLGVPSHRMEAMLSDDRTLWVSDDGSVATMPSDDLALVMTTSVVEVFPGAEALGRWLDRRRIFNAGEAAGAPGRVVIGDDEEVLVEAEVGGIVVHGLGDRFALHLLRDLVHTLRMRTVDDVDDYFEGRGVTVTRSAVPVG